MPYIFHLSVRWLCIHFPVVIPINDFFLQAFISDDLLNSGFQVNVSDERRKRRQNVGVGRAEVTLVPEE